MRLLILLVAVALPPPAFAHDWYEDKLNPVSGGRCCGGYDCHAVDEAQVRSGVDGGFVYLPRGFKIPKAHVQRSPDNRYHICENVALPPGRDRRDGALHHYWTCFFAPDLVN